MPFGTPHSPLGVCFGSIAIRLVLLGMLVGTGWVAEFGAASSEELARLFEEIFRRYSKASAIGFATIPATDEGGLSIAAVNRRIAAAIRGLKARKGAGDVLIAR